MESLTDNHLMLGVKAGDLDKLGLLFERYNRLLFRFFYNMHPNASQSEDLVQNVFVRVLTYRHRFNPDSSFKSWVFAIARNVQIDHFKKMKRTRTEDINDWQDYMGIQSDVSQQMTKQEDLRLLRMALQRLPEDKREILVLSKLKGMRYREIGHLLDCSEGLVKVKVFRALKALKKMYALLEDR
ncbi:MAG: RNA polymerase sigma factor [Bacteroidota bacterium]